MGKYLKLDYKSFAPVAEAVVEKAARDELSIIALDGDQVVACALVEDCVKHQAIDFTIDSKFQPILALLADLEKEFFTNKKFPANLIAHLCLTAVDPDHRGMGLSKKVNFAAMELAYDHNFQFMYSSMTNYLNEKGTLKYLEHEKLLIGRIPYHEYIYNDKKPFRNLAGMANAYIWELCEGAKLRFKQADDIYEGSLQELGVESTL